MKTFEQINNLCDHLNKVGEKALEPGQNLIIIGLDTINRTNFQYGMGQAIDIIACLGVYIDLLASKQNMFSKKDIIRIIDYDGGDEI